MLEPEMMRFIERSIALYPEDAAQMPADEQRRVYDRYCAEFARPRPAGVTTEDAVLETADGPVPLRLYRPAGGGTGLAVYIHGGGFILGSLDSHDVVTAELAATANVAVLAVHYRLAPEHPAPAAFRDCLAVTEAALAGRLPFSGLAAGPVVLAGDSAGGTLSAATALALRDRGVPSVAGLLLIYPSLGFEPALPAAETEAEAPLLTLADMLAYRTAYLGNKTPDAYDFPLLTARFDALPPTLAIGVEHDPLRDDARVFAEKLTAAGGTAEFYLAAGLVHGCLRALGTSPATDRLYARAAAFIRERLLPRRG
jgi:acetyl esterase